jgi:uncharacterized membrane protein
LRCPRCSAHSAGANAWRRAAQSAVSSQQSVYEVVMEPEVFEELMMTALVGALVLFMAFIVWDLAKKSKAGRFGTMILFLALGLGVLGFIIKTVVIAGMEGI